MKTAVNTMKAIDGDQKELRGFVADMEKLWKLAKISRRVN